MLCCRLHIYTFSFQIDWRYAVYTAQNTHMSSGFCIGMRFAGYCGDKRTLKMYFWQSRIVIGDYTHIPHTNRRHSVVHTYVIPDPKPYNFSDNYTNWHFCQEAHHYDYISTKELRFRSTICFGSTCARLMATRHPGELLMVCALSIIPFA